MDNVTQTMTHPSTERHVVLAMIPRGCEDAVIEIILSVDTDANVNIWMGNGPSPAETGEKAQHLWTRNQQTKGISPNPWFRRAVGSVLVDSSTHVSVGYARDDSCKWSVPGILEGVVWLQVETAYLHEIASLRCLGPVMVMVAATDEMQSLTNPNHKVEELLNEMESWISAYRSRLQESYDRRIHQSLKVWKSYVKNAWRRTLPLEAYLSIQERMESDQIHFRMSCIRDLSDAAYPRQDFLKLLMDRMGTTLIPQYSGDAKTRDGWKVNLKAFDLEFVVILLSNGRLAIGLSLVPYPFYNTRGFYAGTIPPDVSKPFVSFDILDGLVRLRPTTAHLLLHMADVQPYEVVLDPCAGIGTIPIEADIFRQSSRCVGLGGDVVLNHPTISSAAVKMEGAAIDKVKPHAAILAAWDAAYLPLRTASIDATISDLPFGKQCLSSNALKQLLPLVLLECARVLVPGKGRLLVLCGSPSLVNSLKSSELYWEKPFSMVIPVSIGGLQAWIVRIERNATRWVEDGHTQRMPNIRNLAKRRERIAKHQSKNSKRKRIQA